MYICVFTIKTTFWTKQIHIRHKTVLKKNIRRDGKRRFVMGMTICHTIEFVQSQFLDGVLIVRYINKMGTNGGGGVVDGVPLQRLQAILVLG
jgi:hypothetical protein